MQWVSNHGMIQVQSILAHEHSKLQVSDDAGCKQSDILNVYRLGFSASLYAYTLGSLCLCSVN